MKTTRMTASRTLRHSAARLLGLLGVRLVVLGFGVASALLVALLLVVRQALPDVGDLLAHLPNAAVSMSVAVSPSSLYAQHADSCTPGTATSVPVRLHELSRNAACCALAGITQANYDQQAICESAIRNVCTPACSSSARCPCAGC